MPPTDDDRPAIACTLDENELADREAWIETHVAPHVEAIHEREDGYTIDLARTTAAYEAATRLAWLEADCCAWATFELELPPGDGPIRWHASTDREAGVSLFDEGLTALQTAIAGLPAIE